MKRTPLRRKSPLRTRARIKPRSTKRNRPPGYEDPDYLAWLRTQGCRVPGCTCRLIEAHHVRHDAKGASIGGHVKDDTRALSLCHSHHMLLHSEPWTFKALIKCELRAWQDRELAAQRAQYLATVTCEEKA